MIRQGLQTTGARRPLAVAVAGIMGLGFGASYAAAQAVLEEVIVTAQKRAENVMDIPATVNAVTADQIEKFRVVSLDDIQSMTPGLLSTRNDARRQSVTLRGITADPDNNAAPPISFYWNEVPIRAPVAFMTFFDLERIEVLRGPQGTLQGRTDPAGALLIHTKRPDMEAFEGTLRQSFSDNNGSQTEFGVSLPIIEDKLSLRVAGLWDKNDGSEYKNIVTGQKEDHENSGWRLSLDWQPVEQARINLVFERADVEAEVPGPSQGDVGNVIGNINAAAAGASMAYNAMLARINDADASNDPTVAQAAQLVQWNIARRAVAPSWLAGLSLKGSDGKSILGSSSDLGMSSKNVLLRIEWEFENHTLTSVTGRRQWDQNNWMDIDYGHLNPLPTMQNTHTYNVDWSQEIRLNSNDNPFWNYTLGVFWEDFGATGKSENSTDLGGPFSIYGAMAGLRNGDLIQHLAIPNGRRPLAVFMHNRFELTERTNLQVGLRWQEIDTWARVTADLINNYHPAPEVGPITNPAFAFLNPNLTSAGVANIFTSRVRVGDYIPLDLTKKTERKVTGGIKVSHYLNDSDMVYLSLDRSFRPSGTTITPAQLAAKTLIFDGETSDSFEVGYKGLAFDGTLRYTAAAFYQKYSKYQPKATTVNVLVQQGLNRVPQLAQGGLIFNADAVIQGAEVEWTALIGEHFQLSGGVSYADARFDSGEKGPCNRPFTAAELADPAIEVATCDIGGEHVSSIPNWSANLNAEYTIPTSIGEFFVRPLLTYMGERKDRLAPLQKFDDYVLLNLYAGLRADDGRWDATLWVKNLTDEDTDNVFSIPAAHAIGGSSNFTRAGLVPPRLIGATLTWNFGY
ncbi:MAG: TonB-dependent receptor plug domain-containing protein [Pseudomonadales bacterium]|jgi:iron complex outermembrane receptor protein|nr:TonB-dependent receptor plug domain-containing protein [Pseudomonadales bacterium]MCP5336720.1 TonB-dependent receptor plug domain-containing protein [Pseudomonadales bacterium]